MQSQVGTKRPKTDRLADRQPSRETGRQTGKEERSCPYREVWRRIGAGFLEQLSPHLFSRSGSWSFRVSMAIHCNEALSWKMMLPRDLDLCGYSCTHVHSLDSNSLNQGMHDLDRRILLPTSLSFSKYFAKNIVPIERLREYRV